MWEDGRRHVFSVGDYLCILECPALHHDCDITEGDGLGLREKPGASYLMVSVSVVLVSFVPRLSLRPDEK